MKLGYDYNDDYGIHWLKTDTKQAYPNILSHSKPGTSESEYGFDFLTG